MRGGEIFVTVGTHTQQFSRLLKKIDGLVAGGGIRGRVFAQTGNSGYEPKNFEFKKFLSPAEYENAIARSSLVISHAGAGAIINALKQGRTLIVVPRLKKYGEHTNDHQVDLARALEERGKIIAVYDVSGLEDAIKRSAGFRARETGGKAGIVKALNGFLEREGLLSTGK